MLEVSLEEPKLSLKNAIEFMSAKFYLSSYDCNICNTRFRNPSATVCGHVVKYEFMEPQNTQDSCRTHNRSLCALYFNLHSLKPRMVNSIITFLFLDLNNLDTTTNWVPTSYSSYWKCNFWIAWHFDPLFALSQRRRPVKWRLEIHTSGDASQTMRRGRKSQPHTASSSVPCERQA